MISAIRKSGESNWEGTPSKRVPRPSGTKTRV
jgi:hypothetical protein